MTTPKLIFFLVFILPLHLFSQAPNKKPKDYDYAFLKNKKPSFYQRMMNKKWKNGEKLMACAYGIHTLTVGKKKHIKKATEFLNKNWKPTIQETTKETNELEEQIQIFEGEITAMNAQHLTKLYKKLTLLNDLSSEKNSSFVLKDYSNEKEKAFQKRGEIYKKTAEFLFQKAQMIKESSKSRADFLIIIRKLDRALYYDSQRADINQLKDQLKEGATMKFGVAIVDDKINHSGVSSNKIRNTIWTIVNDFLTKPEGKNLSYFSLIPLDKSLNKELINVQLTVSVHDVNYNYHEFEPYVKDKEKKIKDKEVEKVIKASYTEYSKQVRTTLEGKYTIKDLETGKILKTETLSAFDDWTHKWAKYAGNIDALNKTEKYKTSLKNKPYPNETKLAEGAAFKLANTLSGIVINLAKIHGK